MEDSIEDVKLEDSIEDVKVEDSIEDVKEKDSIEDVKEKDSIEDVKVEDSIEDVKVEDSIEEIPIKNTTNKDIKELSIKEVPLIKKDSIDDIKEYLESPSKNDSDFFRFTPENVQSFLELIDSSHEPEEIYNNFKSNSEDIKSLIDLVEDSKNNQEIITKEFKSSSDDFKTFLENI